MARLDALINQARETLERDEPISGHFHPLFPRTVQLSLYRSFRDAEIKGLAKLVRFLPLIRRAVERPIYEEALRRAIGILAKVKISDPARIAHQYPHELSGGMQQRSLIAIALSCNPRLLIADEPTTALDVTIQAQILDLIRKMKVEFGSSVLIITHDLGIIAEMCNRVCVMYAGIIAENATVRAVFKSPLHPYTQGLMKAVPSHTVRRDALEIIRGSVPNLIRPPPGCRFHPRCPMVMPTCGWSPREVGERLREQLRAMGRAAPWPFDVDAIRWEEAAPAELHATFPGMDVDRASDAIRVALEEGRAQPALGAIVSVEAARGEGDGAFVRIRILEPRKPPEFLPEPGHAVACLLYETPQATAVAGGALHG
ncbi:MAG TPA: ABC transporter ATP-binding protein [Thermoplasmata archaeon]|nr:ABC transporter ATP-binding protein [Thermoplasmata archaeon]